MAEDAVRNKIFEYKAVSTLLQQIFTTFCGGWLAPQRSKGPSFWGAEQGGFWHGAQCGTES